MRRPEILMLKGLPASGKTTYAKELLGKGYVRVSKDDIRKMMDDGEYSPDKEARINYIRDSAITTALMAGESVVVDDTNFEEKTFKRMSKIAEDLDASLEVLFIDTPLDECLRRNVNREDSVPESVIREMHNTHIRPLKELHRWNEELEEAIIIDVDGTLSHIGDRDLHDASRAMEDTPDEAIVSIVNLYYNHGYKVIIVTGRSAQHRRVTINWLETNDVPYDELYTRPDNDKRSDAIVKKEIYEKNIEPMYNIKFVIEDRPSVCRMWREVGLKVLQVGDPHVEF